VRWNGLGGAVACSPPRRTGWFAPSMAAKCRWILPRRLEEAWLRLPMARTAALEPLLGCWIPRAWEKALPLGASFHQLDLLG